MPKIKLLIWNMKETDDVTLQGVFLSSFPLPPSSTLLGHHSNLSVLAILEKIETAGRVN